MTKLSSRWNGLGVVCAGVALLAAPAVGLAQNFTLTTVAGNGTAGFTGDGGAATSAELSYCFGVAVDAAGNLYIADQFNLRVRKVSTSGTISTVAGSGTAPGYTGDGGAATSATLSIPLGVALDSSGNLYIADAGNNVIRKVNTSGTISTLAGNSTGTAGYTGDGGAATSGELNSPSAVVVDAAGNVYVADTGNHVIRKISTAGILSTFAGNNTAGYSGDGGAATSAELFQPEGVAMDRAGNLYIADSGNNVVRVVNTAGVIRTIAGNGASGASGDGGAATSGELNFPKGVAVDAAGNVFIADTYNSVIREVSSSGILSTIQATVSQLNFPSGVAVGSDLKVYLADNQNSEVRLLTPVWGAPAVGTQGVISASGFGSFPAVAPGGWIEIYGSNLGFTSRGWAGADFTGVNAPTTLDGTSVTIGGQAAFVDYVSPGQVNVQASSTVAAGPQPLVVTTPGGASAAYTVMVNAAEPGMLAPASFLVGGNQYVAALFLDGKTFVAPVGAISGVTSRPAHPGDTIVIYGVGFGAVSPATAAGQIVQANNALVAPFQLFFGSTAATVTYGGLAPQAVGLYQFNVTVPGVATSNVVPLTFTLGGVSGTQTLYTAVQD